MSEALAEGVCDAEFERLVHRIDTGPIHPGNKVKVFINGEETFASVAQAIESATQEILLETYILKDDATGHELAERLGPPNGPSSHPTMRTSGRTSFELYCKLSLNRGQNKLGCGLQCQFGCVDGHVVI